jgi:hypothetical protein
MMKLLFEYPEDEGYFARVLAGGDVKLLHKKFGQYFDFRPSEIKLAELAGTHDGLWR